MKHKAKKNIKKQTNLKQTHTKMTSIAKEKNKANQSKNIKQKTGHETKQ